MLDEKIIRLIEICSFFPLYFFLGLGTVLLVFFLKQNKVGGSQYLSQFDLFKVFLVWPGIMMILIIEYLIFLVSTKEDYYE